MAQKNETTTLFLAILFVLAILGIGAWWITERLRDKPKDLPTPTPSPSDSEMSTVTPPVSTPSASIPISSFSQVEKVPEGTFKYGGSTTWVPIREKVKLEIQKILPGFELIYVDPKGKDTPGSNTGIKMLLANELDFSQSSRSLKDDEIQKGLKQIPVAIDGIAIAVHPSLNIPGLTLEQLKDIYTGKITNWNQVGGPDLKITPYSRQKEDGGTVEYFIKEFLQEQPLGANVDLAATTTDGASKVAANPGGIYYASAPEILQQCGVKPLPIGLNADELVPPYKTPFARSYSECVKYGRKVNIEGFRTRNYPKTRELFVIVKQNGQKEQQAGEAYANLLLTTQGQELIEKAGFVKIR